MPARRIALTLALILVSARASAQVSDGDKATARALAQQGQEALDKRDFATAADRFDRARQIVSAPTLGLGLARAEVGLGRWVAAAETYRRVVREGVPAGAPPPFVKAVAEARADLEALEPRIPSVVVNVAGAPSPHVTLDGAPLSNAVLGVSRPVDPGRHTLRAEADGFAAVEAVVTVAERGSETVTLTLDHRVAGPVTPAPGGPPVAGEPPPPLGPDAGSPRRTVGFVGIGVGAAGLLVGAITGGLAVGKHGTLAGECQNGVCIGHQSDLDGFHTLTTLADVGLVAGGVLAAAGIVLVATAPRPGARPTAWVAPVVGRGFIGAQGRF